MSELPSVTIPTGREPAPVTLSETSGCFIAECSAFALSASAKTRDGALLALGRQAYRERQALGLVGRARLQRIRETLAKLDGALLSGSHKVEDALALRVWLRALGCQARAKVCLEGWRAELVKHMEAVARYVDRSAAAGSLGRPGARYAAILADPPWMFGDAGTRLAPQYEGEQRAAGKRYDALPLPEILALGEQVRACAADDALLFLWLPASLAAQDYHGRVMRAWGFVPKTMVPWVKTRADGQGVAIGGGHYTRTAHEELAVGARGDRDVVLLDTVGDGHRLVLGSRGRGSILVTRRDVPGVIFAPRRAHSEKPDEQYDLVEKLLGDVPRIELFARRARPGWDAWGDEAPGEGALQ